MGGWALPLLWGGLMYPFKVDFEKIAKWFIPKPEDQTRFLEIYQSSDWPSSTWTIDRVDRFFRDAFFLCPARETSTHWSAHGQPVYDYVFAFNMHTNITGLIHGFTATHAFELPFVFRNWLGIGVPLGNFGEWKKMSDVMSCTWASFVKCQKPKCLVPPRNCAKALEHVPRWPAFTPSERKYISFKQPTSTIETIRSRARFPDDEYPGDDRCDFWKTDRLEWQSSRKYPEISKESMLSMAAHFLGEKFTQKFVQAETLLV